MKCRYCGHEIPDGVLYCENCGKEVRIVPDYNPLDDILAQEIVGSINGEPTGLDLSDTERLRRTASQRRTTGRTGPCKRSHRTDRCSKRSHGTDDAGYRNYDGGTGKPAGGRRSDGKPSFARNAGSCWQ